MKKSKEQKVAQKNYYNAQAHNFYSDNNEVIAEGSMVMNVGDRVSPKFKGTEKGDRLIAYMQKNAFAYGIGYKVSYETLIDKLWKKWEGNRFNASDVLSASDVKAAIKTMYKEVALGERKFSDGKQYMLKFICATENGKKKLYLKYTDFDPNFLVVAEEEKKVTPLADKLSKLLDDKALTDAEKEVLKEALAKLGK